MIKLGGETSVLRSRNFPVARESVYGEDRPYTYGHRINDQEFGGAMVMSKLSKLCILRADLSRLNLSKANDFFMFLFLNHMDVRCS